nr:hypothetical protein [Paludibacteraceae bacterium]
MKKTFRYITVIVCIALWAVVPSVQAETIDSYGTEYVAISNYHPGEHCVITALFEPTTVRLSNGQQFVLMRGERRTVTAEQWTMPDGTRTRTLYIRADEPIRVAHTTSYGENLVTTLLPSLSCEGAREQRYTFVQRTSKAVLFLIAPFNEQAGFMLDGKMLKGNNTYAVTGTDEWVYQVVDLGTRKAGSTLVITGPGEHFYAAVVGNSYDYLNECELEASVSIDTIRSNPEFILREEPMMAAATATSSQQNTGSMEALENGIKNEEEDLDKDLEEMLNTSHRGVLYLQGAYAGMPLKMEGYSTKMGLGYGVAAGALYEFQKKSFLMQTGAGFYWLDRRMDILNQPAPNRYDRALSAGIEIPVLFGQNFQAVYYLLGLKLGFDILDKHTSACSPNEAADNQLMPPIIQETGYDLRFSLDPRLSAEFGFNLGQERHSWVHSRLAIFADYGFNTNMWGSVPAGEGVSTIVGEPADYQSYQLTHFYLLPQTAGKILQHFQVGLKFTLVLGE